MGSDSAPGTPRGMQYMLRDVALDHLTLLAADNDNTTGKNAMFTGGRKMDRVHMFNSIAAVGQYGVHPVEFGASICLLALFELFLSFFLAM